MRLPVVFGPGPSGQKGGGWRLAVACDLGWTRARAGLYRGAKKFSTGPGDREKTQNASNLGNFAAAPQRGA